jgi:hypothetical protein
MLRANVNIKGRNRSGSTNVHQPDSFASVTIPVIGRVRSSTIVKITSITSVLAATAATGIVCAPIVSADAETQTTDVISQSLGTQAKLVDGAVVQGWTISDLKPSSDTIPHPVNGTLWEATATDEAIQGSATPIVSNLNARGADGQTYRALFGAATPQGVNPSTLGQGQTTSGKVYFDVTGSSPESVVYNAGGQDRLIWVQPPPSTSQSGTGSSSYGAGSYSATSPATVAAPAATPAASAAGGTPPAAPAAAGAEVPLPAGSQGTPLPAGSQGTPLPAGSQGTPLPAGSTPVPPAPGAPMAPAVEGAPLPASTQTAPEGSAGTPLPPEVLEALDEVPTPTTYTPAPTP